MTQEDKQLLLIDLCCRLPYLTKVKCPFDNEPYTLLSINWDKEIVVIGFMNVDTYVTSKQKLVKIKPYLRPLSNMTEEEIIDFLRIPDLSKVSKSFINDFKSGNFGIMANMSNYARNIDWLNKKMFDYRGLIPRGLALSTEVFNPYKD